MEGRNTEHIASNYWTVLDSLETIPTSTIVMPKNMRNLLSFCAECRNRIETFVNNYQSGLDHLQATLVSIRSM